MLTTERGLPGEAAFSWDLPPIEALLMGRCRGESGGVERDDERESCPEDKRGVAVEVVGVTGGVGMLT